MRVIEKTEEIVINGAGLRPVPADSSSRMEQNAKLAVETCGKGNFKEVTETSFTCK
jgi:hypothetical protein